jgi:hypothetical protein
MSEVALARQKCLNHPSREAAARCTVCLRYYCRECVVENDDRLICATCLVASRRAAPKNSTRFADLRLWVAAAAGFVVAWLFFYMLGLALMMLPSAGGAGVWRTP